MTKSKPSLALKMLIDINWVNLNITKWVERAERTIGIKGKKRDDRKQSCK